MQGERLVRDKQRGVTLIELLTVIIVIGILTAIAVPSYRQYTIRANRTDAKTSLLFLAGALERCYTRYNSYVYNADPAVGCNVLPAATGSENGYYQISATTRTAQTFELTATPQGKQADDTGCGSLKVNQLNDRTSTGSKPAKDCWGK
jgi:type IV pilus assembly protein PilE